MQKYTSCYPQARLFSLGVGISKAEIIDTCGKVEELSLLGLNKF